MMLEEKHLIVGGRYVPLTKRGAVLTTSASVCYAHAKKRNQPFLFYTGKDDDGVFYFDDEFSADEITGDMFLPSDMVRYVDPEEERFSAHDIEMFANKLYSAVVESGKFSVQGQTIIHKILQKELTDLKTKWV